jgi:hypothetical protein
MVTHELRQASGIAEKDQGFCFTNYEDVPDYPEHARNEHYQQPNTEVRNWSSREL